MAEPSDHASQRGWLEDYLRRIPGFRGYLEKEYRRESDRMARDYLVDRLQRAKQSIDGLARAMADSGRLETLPELDRLRGRLDKLIGRIRGAMQGYRGFFDFVQVDEARLDDVYQHDMDLMRHVESFEQSCAALPEQQGELADRLRDLFRELEQLDRRWSHRDALLRGWGNPWDPLR
jgi:DNA repair ATPase RecN